MFFSFNDTDNQLKKAAYILKILGYVFVGLLTLSAFVTGTVLWTTAYDFWWAVLYLLCTGIGTALVFVVSMFINELMTLFIYSFGELLEAAYDIVDNTEKED